MAEEYSYTGYESAFVPTPQADTNSQNVERKTDKTQTSTNKSKKDADTKEIYVSSGFKNVLSRYRSYTYNFTLAAINKNQVNNAENYRKNEFELTILRSGGKGQEGIANPNPEEVKLREDIYKIAKDANLKGKSLERSKGELENLQMIQGFNADSPGRFDMYIDTVEIDTIMAFNKEGGTTQPTSIKFDVYEPYSINGFIEALHIAAVKAGYPNYTTASFILKIQFIGYPDNQDLPDPEVIEKSSRYFLIGFTGLEVEITERGTRYNCSAIPWNEKAFGQPGKLKKPTKITGETVVDILEDLMLNMTDQEIQNAKKSGNDNYYDSYRIVFQKQSGSDWVSDKFGKIAQSKMAELGVDSSLYQMIDPGENKKKNNYKIAGENKTQTDTVKDEIPYEPKKNVTQFPENVNLHEIIAAVIRDSEYVANLIKNLEIDDQGMVEYFNIRTEVTNKDGLNPRTKKPNQTFTYVVTPYRLHFTSIPNLESSLVDEKKLKKSTLREYNYIYTGLNTEVRNFRLNFNNLYFEAIPQDIGNKEAPGIQTAARPGNKPALKINESAPDSTSSVPQPSKRSDPEATNVLPPSGYNAGLPKNDPYSVLARSMHEKVINSVSLLTGELEIIGDPLYLVTGGTGNYTPKMVSTLETDDGEVAHLRGQVLIAINFRNPIDINSFEKGGMMYFDSNRVPFSGVYRVNTVKNTFKDGQFNQRLSIIRVPGQIIDQPIEPSDPKDIIKTVPNPYDQVKEDTSNAKDFGQRVDSSTLEEQLDRGIPTTGVNFSNSPGGLGGDDPSLKSQTFGNFPNQGSLDSNSSQIGLPLPSDFSRNVRLSQLGLAGLSQFSLENASKVKSTISTLLGNNSKSLTKSLAQELVAGSLERSLNISHPGSGIGAGSSVKLSSLESKLSADSLSLTGGLPKTIGSFNVDTVYRANQSSDILSNVSDNVSSLLGSRSDPNAIGARVGIDVNKVSGLANLFSSKLTKQINQYSLVPDDVNLTQAVEQGLRLEYMNPGDLRNLPATQPDSSAPLPDSNMSYLNNVVSRGGNRSLANLYGVNNVNQISESLLSKQSIGSSLDNVSPGQFNPYSNNRVNLSQVDVTLSNDRIDSSKKQLAPLLGTKLVNDQLQSQSVVGVFGSKTSGKNPLDKLVSTKPNVTSPVYSGNDPIIRKNLGLPPV